MRLNKGNQEVSGQGVAELEARLAACHAELAAACEREQAAHVRAAELARANGALRQAIEGLRGLDDLDAFLARVTAAAEQVSGAAHATVFLVDTDRRELQARMFVRDGIVQDIASDPTLAPWRQPMRDGSGYSQEIADRLFGEPGHWWVTTDDPLMRSDPARDWHEAQGHRSVAMVPMWRGARPFGFFGLAFREAVRPSAAKLEMVQALAQQVTLAFELSRLAKEAQAAAVALEREQAAQERAAELARANEALRQAIEGLRGLDDLDAFLARVVAAAERVAGAALATVFLIDVDRREMQGRLFVRSGAVLDIAADPMLAPWREPLREGSGYSQEIADRIFATPGHWWAATDDPLMPAPIRVWHEAQGHCSAAHVPMWRDGRALGFLGLGFREAAQPSEAKLEMVQVLAQQATLAFELTRLADEAREAAVAREREQAAEARAAELARANAALTRSTARLAEQADLGAFLDTVLVEAAGQAGALSNALFLHDPLEHTLSMTAFVRGGTLLDIAADPRMALWREPVPAGLTPVWERLQAGRPLLQVVGVDDPDIWAFAVPWHQAMEHASLICVPLFAGERALGFMGLCFATSDAVAPERVELAQALANQAALALELTRLADEAREAAVARERELAAQQRAAELARANEALRGTLARLAQEPDLDAFLGHMLSEVARHAGARAGHLFLLDPVAETLRQHAVVRDGQVHLGHHSDDPPLFHAPFPADITPAFRTAVERAGQWWAELTTLGAFPYPGTLWPGTFEWHKRMGHTAISSMALMVGDRPVGFLGLAYTDRTTLAPSETELVEALANQAALAIELKRLADEAREVAVAREREEAAQERAAELARANEALRRTTARLAEQADLRAFFGQALAELAGQLGAPTGALFLHDSGADTLSLCAAVLGGVEASDPASEPQLATWATPLPAGGVPGWAALLREGRPLLVDLGPPGQAAAASEWYAQRGLSVALRVPLVADGTTLGFMSLAFPSPPVLPPEKVELAQALAHQAALAVQLDTLGRRARQAAVADERNRAAREIHDTLAQCFTGILVQLQAAVRFTAEDPGLARSCLGLVEELARDGLTQARRSVAALLPDALEVADLPGALRHLARRATTGTPVPALVEVEGEARPLPPEPARHLLRVAQEALANAQRYARGATRIRLALAYGRDAVELRVEDDGCGFDPDRAHDAGGFGLAGMRQRAGQAGGTFLLRSAPGQGTAVRVRVPLGRAQQGEQT